MISLKVHSSLRPPGHSSTDCITIDFDTRDGIETLPYQIISVLNGELEAEDLVVVDKNGLIITSVDDMIDIQFVEFGQNDANNGEVSVAIAEVWVFSHTACDFNKFCSSNVPDTQSYPGHASDLAGCIQASYRVVDMPYHVCGRCRFFFDSALIVEGSAQSDSNHLHCFQCDIDKLIGIGIAPTEAATTLKSEAESFLGLNGAGLAMPILLYLRRQLLQQALEQLRRFPIHHVHGGSSRSREYQEFRARVESGARTVLVYEDPAQQEAARQHIDFAKVLEYALQHMGIAELPPASTVEETSAPFVPYSKEVQELEERALLVGLMRWFKVDFFKWCNKPACENPACNAPPGRMDGVGTVEPSSEERNIGGAGRTEVYKCRDCNQQTRFPRFNNPAHLMISRRGRCGEFANAFCLICRALHLDAQYVLDFTDHVWCEVWLPSIQRFVHCDPCERAQDAPLMYEQGWNKKLTHVLSFSRYGVSDSIARYSRKQNTVRTRRCAEVASESFVADIITAKDKELEVAYAMRRASLPPVPLSSGVGSSGELPWDAVEGADVASSSPVASCLRTLQGGRSAVQALCGLDVSWAQVQQRKRHQHRELEALLLSTDTTNSTFSKQGRISGDLEWKLSRGEIGDSTVAAAVSAGGGSAAVAGLCSTEGPVAAAPPPPLAAPEWLQQVRGNQRILFKPDARSSTDVMFATHRNPLFPCEGGQACAPLADCYQWGGALFPRVANCGETIVALSATGKIVKVGTERAEGCVHVHVRCDALKAAEFATANTANTASLTRNGVTESNPTPQYVALTCSNSDSATHEDAATMALISNYVCSVPSFVLFPTDNKSAEHMTQVAQAKLLSERDLLGFSIVFVGNNPSAEVSHVLLFGASGYPLVAFAGAVTNARSVDSAQTATDECMRPSTEVMTRRCYHHLGGACHNDTAVFDSAAFLQSLLSVDPGAHRSLRLCKLVVWAGENLVNGIQCTFELETGEAQPICVMSPKCSSDNDSPVAHVLELAPGDRVVSVQCRSGALVDSVEITTQQGKVLRAGGGGGNNLVKIDIPEEQMLCGFFGGTGGHLHHLGVVLIDTPLLATATATATSTYAKILSLCDELRMAECGMLQHYDSRLGADLHRQSNVVQLAVLVTRLFESNSPETASACLRTIIIYINNILKDLTERKYQTIKLSNPVFQQSILQARGGIELLLFGPAAFRLTLSALSASLGQQVVQSALADEILQKDKSASFRALYASWLRQYVGFLSTAVESGVK